MRSFYLPLALACCILAGTSTATADSHSHVKSYTHVVRAGKIANPALVELSGLAYSQLNSNVLWAINDGNTQTLLFALGSDGADMGTVSVEDSRNRDWEDIASFKLNDTAYLLVADVGDNYSRRKTNTIYIIEEPRIIATQLKIKTSVKVDFQIRFTYEDGPRDCEAVAVDTKQQKILLLSKRTSPVVLYQLPLKLSKKKSTLIARRVIAVSGIMQPTAMDISSSGMAAAILTYNQAYLFTRHTGEDWSIAFSRKPKVLRFPALFQQEAICFNNSSQSIYISSEGRSAPLLRIDLDAVSTRQ